MASCAEGLRPTCDGFVAACAEGLRPTCDGFVAACAEGAPLGVVVGLAVWHALVVEERTAVERQPAVLREEKRVSDGFHMGEVDQGSLVAVMEVCEVVSSECGWSLH